MNRYGDRKQAGKLLLNQLRRYNIKEGIVLAIPRGGVVIGKEIASGLDLPLDIIVTRKIGVPYQQELALGAIDPDGRIVWKHNLLKELGLTTDNLIPQIKEQLEEIKRREKLYRGSSQKFKLVDQVVILVDDGIATGSTIEAAINYLRNKKVKRIILATPVASKESVSKLSTIVDELVVLQIPESFYAVGQFYEEFPQVSDEEVIQLLK